MIKYPFPIEIIGKSINFGEFSESKTTFRCSKRQENYTQECLGLFPKSSFTIIYLSNEIQILDSELNLSDTISFDKKTDFLSVSENGDYLVLGFYQGRKEWEFQIFQTNIEDLRLNKRLRVTFHGYLLKVALWNERIVIITTDKIEIFTFIKGWKLQNSIQNKYSSYKIFIDEINETIILSTFQKPEFIIIKIYCELNNFITKIIKFPCKKEFQFSAIKIGNDNSLLISHKKRSLIKIYDSPELKIQKISHKRQYKDMEISIDSQNKEYLIYLSRENELNFILFKEGEEIGNLILNTDLRDFVYHSIYYFMERSKNYFKLIFMYSDDKMVSLKQIKIKLGSLIDVLKSYIDLNDEAILRKFSFLNNVSQDEISKCRWEMSDKGLEAMEQYLELEDSNYILEQSKLYHDWHNLQIILKMYTKSISRKEELNKEEFSKCFFIKELMKICIEHKIQLNELNFEGFEQMYNEDFESILSSCIINLKGEILNSLLICFSKVIIDKIDDIRLELLLEEKIDIFFQFINTDFSSDSNQSLKFSDFENWLKEFGIEIEPFESLEIIQKLKSMNSNSNLTLCNIESLKNYFYLLYDCTGNISLCLQFIELASDNGYEQDFEELKLPLKLADLYIYQLKGNLIELKLDEEWILEKIFKEVSSNKVLFLITMIYKLKNIYNECSKISSYYKKILNLFDKFEISIVDIGAFVTHFIRERDIGEDWFVENIITKILNHKSYFQDYGIIQKLYNFILNFDKKSENTYKSVSINHIYAAKIFFQFNINEKLSSLYDPNICKSLIDTFLINFIRGNKKSDELAIKDKYYALNDPTSLVEIYEFLYKSLITKEKQGIYQLLIQKLLQNGKFSFLTIILKSKNIKLEPEIIEKIVEEVIESEYKTALSFEYLENYVNSSLNLLPRTSSTRKKEKNILKLGKLLAQNEIMIRPSNLRSNPSKIEYIRELKQLDPEIAKFPYRKLCRVVNKANGNFCSIYNEPSISLFLKELAYDLIANEKTEQYQTLLKDMIEAKSTYVSDIIVKILEFSDNSEIDKSKLFFSGLETSNSSENLMKMVSKLSIYVKLSKKQNKMKEIIKESFKSTSIPNLVESELFISTEKEKWSRSQQDFINLYTKEINGIIFRLPQLSKVSSFFFNLLRAPSESFYFLALIDLPTDLLETVLRELIKIKLIDHKYLLEKFRTLISMKKEDILKRGKQVFNKEINPDTLKDSFIYKSFEIKIYLANKLNILSQHFNNFEIEKIYFDEIYRNQVLLSKVYESNSLKFYKDFEAILPTKSQNIVTQMKANLIIHLNKDKNSSSKFITETFEKIENFRDLLLESCEFKEQHENINGILTSLTSNGIMFILQNYEKFYKSFLFYLKIEKIEEEVISDFKDFIELLTGNINLRDIFSIEDIVMKGIPNIKLNLEDISKIQNFLNVLPISKLISRYSDFKESECYLEYLKYNSLNWNFDEDNELLEILILLLEFLEIKDLYQFLLFLSFEEFENCEAFHRIIFLAQNALNVNRSYKTIPGYYNYKKKIHDFEKRFIEIISLKLFIIDNIYSDKDISKQTLYSIEIIMKNVNYFIIADNIEIQENFLIKVNTLKVCLNSTFEDLLGKIKKEIQKFLLISKIQLSPSKIINIYYEEKFCSDFFDYELDSEINKKFENLANFIYLANKIIGTRIIDNLITEISQINNIECLINLEFKLKNLGISLFRVNEILESVRINICSQKFKKPWKSLLFQFISFEYIGSIIGCISTQSEKKTSYDFITNGNITLKEYIKLLNCIKSEDRDKLFTIAAQSSISIEFEKLLSLNNLKNNIVSNSIIDFLDNLTGKDLYHTFKFLYLQGIILDLIDNKNEINEKIYNFFHKIASFYSKNSLFYGKYSFDSKSSNFWVYSKEVFKNILEQNCLQLIIKKKYYQAGKLICEINKKDFSKVKEIFEFLIIFLNEKRESDFGNQYLVEECLRTVNKFK